MAGLAPYLQLLSLQALQLASGAKTTAWTGAVQSVAIAHGLGRKPAVVIATVINGTPVGCVAQQTADADVTNIYLSTNVAGTYGVQWIAIG